MESCAFAHLRYTALEFRLKDMGVLLFDKNHLIFAWCSYLIAIIWKCMAC